MARSKWLSTHSCSLHPFTHSYAKTDRQSKSRFASSWCQGEKDAITRPSYARWWNSYLNVQMCVRSSQTSRMPLESYFQRLGWGNASWLFLPLGTGSMAPPQGARSLNCLYAAGSCLPVLQEVDESESKNATPAVTDGICQSYLGRQHPVAANGMECLQPTRPNQQRCWRLALSAEPEGSAGRHQHLPPIHFALPGSSNCRSNRASAKWQQSSPRAEKFGRQRADEATQILAGIQRWDTIHLSPSKSLCTSLCSKSIIMTFVNALSTIGWLHYYSCIYLLLI